MTHALDFQLCIDNVLHLSNRTWCIQAVTVWWLLDVDCSFILSKKPWNPWKRDTITCSPLLSVFSMHTSLFYNDDWVWLDTENPKLRVNQKNTPLRPLYLPPWIMHHFPLSASYWCCMLMAWLIYHFGTQHRASPPPNYQLGTMHEQWLILKKVPQERKTEGSYKTATIGRNTNYFKPTHPWHEEDSILQLKRDNLPHALLTLSLSPNLQWIPCSHVWEHSAT